MTPSADTIFHNAAVLTMDPARPSATALAIEGGTIVAVGTDDEVLALKGPSTKLIDARGRTLMPGLNESHIHLFVGAVELSQLSLFEQSGFETIKGLIRTYAAENPELPIVLCGSADYTILGEDRSLDRHVLDQILPDRPLALMSPDHHTVWANTAALEQAGLLNGRVLSAGNAVVMGDDGRATGELQEAEAFGPIYELTASGGRDKLGMVSGLDPATPPSPEERAADKDVLERGLRHLASYGITSFQNMDGNRYTLALLAELEREGRLLCRGRVPARYISGSVEEALDRAEEMRDACDTPMLTSGAVKFFIDGVLDSYTAVMSAPYEGRPDWSGEPRFEPEFFKSVCAQADARGLQIAVHSIGDRATQIVLDAFAEARAQNGARDSRHRIEHLEVVREEDFARLKDLGVTASMQPPHPPGQCGLPFEPTITRIGKTNWPRAYAWRRMRDEGIPLILSSDWPVSSVDPWASIHSAMTRQPWHESQPDNRQTLDEALMAYTTTAAYAEFAEGNKGMLREGYLADVVLLDRDLSATAPDDMAEVRALLTVCDGRITHQDAAL
ncbi:amidohydrolase [Alloyangia pacifica]|uniref:amidohydrolase n=1 Tax=Alloyangia pacifica TaxID=311180 RepID=UPI001CFEB2B3|nr:amidohydrolase [Alloyangia pacifica]